MVVNTKTIEELIDGHRSAVKESIIYYSEAIQSLNTKAKIARFFATTFMALGGICAAMTHSSVAKLYPAEFKSSLDTISLIAVFLLTLGGGTLFLDKVFGYSKGWVRYTLAKTELEHLSELFELKISKVSCEEVETDRGKKYFEIMESSFPQVWNLIITETKDWGKQFMADLELLAKKK